MGREAAPGLTETIRGLTIPFAKQGNTTEKNFKEPGQKLS
jgi:hypothetical protein